MTVNDLIRQLQQLELEGHGDLPVKVWNPDKSVDLVAVDKKGQTVRLVDAGSVAS